MIIEKLKISNIIFTNEISIDELINDYTNLIATKLFIERGVINEENKQ